MGSSATPPYTAGNRWFGWQVGKSGEWLGAWRRLPTGVPSSSGASNGSNGGNGSGGAGARWPLADAAASEPPASAGPGPWRLTLAHPACELGPTSPGVTLVQPPQPASQPWRVEYVVHLEIATQGAAAGELHLTWQAAIPPEQDEETIWQLTVDNRSQTVEVVSVLFPLLTSVRIPAAQQETLIYPFFAGLRFPDPTRTLVQPFPGPKGLEVVQAQPVADEPGRYRMEQTYCGQLSMPFLDYSAVVVTARDPKQPQKRLQEQLSSIGLSLGCYDPAHGLVRLRVDVTGAAATARAADPGRIPRLDLALVHPCRIRPNDRWQTPPVSVGLHAGDWHWAADRYRRFARPHLGVKRPRPTWVDRSDSLMAHYDFKWQDGRHVHTFADLLPLYQRAQADGVNHLFVAGWSSGGFDHLYPEYYPDLELGTVMDFIDGVRRIRRAGGQTTFYTNAALFGTESPYHPTLGQAWAVRQADGSPIQLHFFQKDFTVNCRGVAAYQRQMTDTVCWLVGEAGASGVYLDCFAAIGPYACYAPEHHHRHPFTWNQDARSLLAHLDEQLTQRGLTPFLMIEGCGDLYAPYLTAALVHGWYYAYAYPEVFRYTFPEYLTVDMVYPSQGQRFRPAGISALAYDQLHRTFILGHYFWFYDQEDDRFCNFRTDPQMWEYIRQILAVRASVRLFLQRGEFLDDQGVALTSVRAEPPAEPSPSPWPPVVVKRFRLDPGSTGAPTPEAAPADPVAASPASTPEFEPPLPSGATGGELLTIWVRGASPAPPHSPAECWQAAAWASAGGPGASAQIEVEVAQPEWEVWVQTLPAEASETPPDEQQGPPPGAGRHQSTAAVRNDLRWRPWPARLTSLRDGPDGAAGGPQSGDLACRWSLRLPVPPSPVSVILLLPVRATTPQAERMLP